MTPEGGEKRILVVEDAFLIGMDLKISLEQLGWIVLGPAPSASRAMSILERESCDAAILDVNLGRETSESVADYLSNHHVPYFFLTGYDSLNIKDPALQKMPLYRKPMNREGLADAISKHLDNGKAA